jgi:Kyakuja-Dileera-Zisupton transposase
VGDMSASCPMELVICKRENGTTTQKSLFLDADWMRISYANMDFILLSSLVGTLLLLITISYDIACQWWRNFFTRMEEMPDWLKLPPTVNLRFRVPKFHLPVHVKRCWAPFSFNFTPWVGRTDGEGVERNWSWLNGIARCVSMMGLGGRWDTLDDFCNYHNWRKTVNLGKLKDFWGGFSLAYATISGDQLLRKLTVAVPEAVVHHRALCAFSEGLREEHGDVVGEWEQQVLAWEADNTRFCPYDLPEESR